MPAKKLLYIEDECKKPLETDPLYSILDEAGFETTVVEDGEKAFERLNQEQYDVIILDIMLPHRGENIPRDVPRYHTGIHLLKRLRDGEFSQDQNTPVVVISAIADMEDMRKIKEEMHPDKYLEKPIPPPALLDAVNEVLKLKSK